MFKKLGYWEKRGLLACAASFIMGAVALNNAPTLSGKPPTRLSETLLTGGMMGSFAALVTTVFCIYAGDDWFDSE